MAKHVRPGGELPTFRVNLESGGSVADLIRRHVVERTPVLDSPATPATVLAAAQGQPLTHVGSVVLGAPPSTLQKLVRRGDVTYTSVDGGRRQAILEMINVPSTDEIVRGLTAAAAVAVVAALLTELAVVWLLVVGLAGARVLAGRFLPARDTDRLTRDELARLERPLADGGWRAVDVGSRTLPQESAVVLVAWGVVADIRRSPTWADPALDVHRVRLDLDAELAQIADCARDLWLLRQDPPRRESRDDDTAGVDAAIAEHDRTADGLLTILLDRVVALARYRDRLRTIDGQLEDLATVRALRDKHSTLADGTDHATPAEVAKAELAALTVELGDVEAGLRARIEFLRDQ